MKHKTTDVEAQVKAPELLADPIDAKRPSAVQNNRLHATYLSMGLEREKGKKLVHLDFSFPLDPEHEAGGYLPQKVKRAWHYLQESGDKLIQVEGIPDVTFDVFTSPSAIAPALHLVGARFKKAVVSIIEEVGKGKTIKRPRFAFRLLVERDNRVLGFGAWNDGADFWIQLPPTQAGIGDD